MRALTHILFSVICILAYTEFFDVQNIFLFSGIVLFMTLFVDIDEPDSTIGKFLWIIAKPIKIILGHRGLFHSFILPAILFLWSYFFQMTEIGIAIFVGYSSHLVMDMITPHGIYPLYPLSWRIRGPIRVGSAGEYFLRVLLATAIFITLLV
jgi:inner membrane protein